MPKARKRRKTAGRVSEGNVAVQQNTVHKLPASMTKQVARPSGTRSMQNLAFSAMVSLGFWGMTVFCIFFYATDPNHYLYGAIMGLTAVGWTVVVARRWLAYRQRV